MQLKSTLALLLVALCCLTYGKKVCYSENWASQTCGVTLPDSFTAFGGFATVTGFPALNLIAVSHNEECDLSFGSCSSAQIDTTDQVLACTGASCNITLTFPRKVRELTIGKAYSSTVGNRLELTFYRGTQVISTGFIDRTGLDCTVGASSSWSVSTRGGFDRVSIVGNTIGITDVTVCYLGAALFTGGDDDDNNNSEFERSLATTGASYIEIEEGECVTCTDALGVPHYQAYICDSNDSCHIETFSGSDCLEISGSQPVITNAVTELQTLYPVAQTVCLLTNDLPTPEAATAPAPAARHTEL